MSRISSETGWNRPGCRSAPNRRSNTPRKRSKRRNTLAMTRTAGRSRRCHELCFGTVQGDASGRPLGTRTDNPPSVASHRITSNARRVEGSSYQCARSMVKTSMRTSPRAVAESIQLPITVPMANKPDGLCRHCDEWIIRANAKTPWVHVGTMSESCGTYAEPKPESPENTTSGRHLATSSPHSESRGPRKTP